MSVSNYFLKIQGVSERTILDARVDDNAGSVSFRVSTLSNSGETLTPAVVLRPGSAWGLIWFLAAWAIRVGIRQRVRLITGKMGTQINNGS